MRSFVNMAWRHNWYTPLGIHNRLTALWLPCPLLPAPYAIVSGRGDRLFQNAKGDFEKAGVCTTAGAESNTNPYDLK